MYAQAIFMAKVETTFQIWFDSWNYLLKEKVIETFWIQSRESWFQSESDFKSRTSVTKMIVTMHI